MFLNILRDWDDESQLNDDRIGCFTPKYIQCKFAVGSNPVGTLLRRLGFCFVALIIIQLLAVDVLVDCIVSVCMQKQTCMHVTC